MSVLKDQTKIKINCCLPCRFLGRDIITIREAAWLTDNTYKYEDVVRMMGEITATLHGHVKVKQFVRKICSYRHL